MIENKFGIQLSQAVDSLRRLQGLSPHNSLGNKCIGDLTFACEVKSKFPEEVLKLANAIIVNDVYDGDTPAWFAVSQSLHLGKIQKQCLLMK